MAPATPQQPRRQKLAAAVAPSTEQTITALVTDEKFNGAHDFLIQPMVEFNLVEGTVYAQEDEAAIELRFVKKLDDGTFRPGLQTEQILEALMYRHTQMNEVFPSDQFNDLMAGLRQALGALKRRVTDRQERGVMREHKA